MPKYKKFPSMYDESKIEISNAPGKAVPGDKASILYHRKLDMAKAIFESLYGKQTPDFNWSDCIASEDGSPLPSQGMITSDRYRTKTTQKTAYGNFAAFFDANPNGRLQIFMPGSGEFRYVAFNSKTGIYEIDMGTRVKANPDPAVAKQNFDKGLKVWNYLKTARNTDAFKRQTKDASDAIAQEYEENYKAKDIEEPEVKQPEVKEPVKAEEKKPRKITRPAALRLLPASFTGKNDIEKWNRENGQETMYDQIPDKNLNVENAGKVMAAQVLLTALYGKNKKLWKDAVLTDKLRSLPNQKLVLNNRFPSGQAVGTPEAKIAAFFDANPKGELVIYSPSDNKPHTLKVNIAGAFVISRDPIIRSDNEYERKQYDDFVSVNQAKLDPVLLDEEKESEYKKDTAYALNDYAKPMMDIIKARAVEIEPPVPVKPLGEVKRPEEPFNDRAEAFRTMLGHVSGEITRAGNERAFDIKKTIDVLRDYVATSITGYGNPDPASGSTFKRTIEKTVKEIKSFTEGAKDKKLTAAEKNLVNTLNTLSKELQNPDNVLSEIQRGFDLFENFHKEYHLNNKNLPGSDHYSNNTIPWGTRPSVEKLRSMDLTKEDPKEVMGIILWGGVNSYMCSRMIEDYGNGKQTYFAESMDALREKLSDAPFDVQMEYVKEFRAMELALSDRAYKVYTDALDSAPTEMTKEQKEVYAAVKLNESDEFVACQGFNNFRSNFAGQTFGSNLVSFGSVSPDDPMVVNLSQRKASIFIGDLVAGGMDKLLLENGMEVAERDHVTAFEESTYPKHIAANGLAESNPYMDMTELYSQLMDDKESASQSFTNMRDSMKALMSADIMDAVKDPKFGELLSNAERDVKAYRDSHNRYHFTDSGEARFQLSDQLSKKLDTAKAYYERTAAEYKEMQEDPEGYKRKQEEKKSAERRKSTAEQLKKVFQSTEQIDTNLTNAARRLENGVTQEEFLSELKTQFYNQKILSPEEFVQEVNAYGKEIKMPDQQTIEAKKEIQKKALETLGKTYYNQSAFDSPKKIKDIFQGSVRSTEDFANEYDHSKGPENIKRLEAIGDKKHPEAQMKAVKEVFQRFQKIDPELFGKKHTDAELMENFPKMYAFASPLAMELENFISNTKSKGVNYEDPELKQLVNQAKENAKAVAPFFTYYTCRMKELTNEYYPYLPDDYSHESGISLDSDESSAQYRFQTAFDPAFKFQAVAEMALYKAGKEANAEVDVIYDKDGNRYKPKDAYKYEQKIGTNEPLIFFFKGKEEPLAVTVSNEMPSKFTPAQPELAEAAIKNHKNYNKVVSLEYAKEKYREAEENYRQGKISKSDFTLTTRYFVAAKQGITEKELLEKQDASFIRNANEDLGENDINEILSGDLESAALNNFVKSYEIYSEYEKGGSKAKDAEAEEKRAWEAYQKEEAEKARKAKELDDKRQAACEKISGLKQLLGNSLKSAILSGKDKAALTDNLAAYLHICEAYSTRNQKSPEELETQTSKEGYEAGMAKYRDGTREFLSKVSSKDLKKTAQSENFDKALTDCFGKILGDKVKQENAPEKTATKIKSI